MACPPIFIYLRFKIPTPCIPCQDIYAAWADYNGPLVTLGDSLDFAAHLTTTLPTVGDLAWWRTVLLNVLRNP